jgi:hypothetical protein
VSPSFVGGWLVLPVDPVGDTDGMLALLIDDGD